MEPQPRPEAETPSASPAAETVGDDLARIRRSLHRMSEERREAMAHLARMREQSQHRRDQRGPQ